MRPSATRKFRIGHGLLAGMLLGMAAASFPLSGSAEFHSGGHRSGFGHHGGHHGPGRGDHRGHHGSRFGHHRGFHGASHGHVIVLGDPGITYRGPLGFELHYALRQTHALHRRDYATAGYYPDCRTVYKDTYMDGYPVTVSGLMCYDEYGYPYIVPESRRLMEYYE